MRYFNCTPVAAGGSLPNCAHRKVHRNSRICRSSLSELAGFRRAATLAPIPASYAMFSGMKLKPIAVPWVAAFLVCLCGTKTAMASQGQSQTYKVPTDILAQAAFDSGLKAYQNKDFATALKAWTLSANAGDVAAEYNLGLMYQDGTGTAVNTTIGLKWLAQAATDGDYDAQIDLAKTYLIGYNVKPDIKESEKWLAQAYTNDPQSASADIKTVINRASSTAQMLIALWFYSDAGDHRSYADAFTWFLVSANNQNAVSQYMLATMYEAGKGVTVDIGNALKFYGESASQGYAPAQNDLGVIFQNGQGVPRNYAIAFKLISAAANQGLVIAQTNLCRNYIYGYGTSRDMIQAYKWCNLAASQGDQDASKELDALQNQMSQRQIALAQKLSIEWVAQPSSAADIQNSNEDQHHQHGQFSEKVKAAQTLLISVGYNIGVADGVLGPRTVHAILDFEAKHGLTQDGQVSDALIALLAQADSQRKGSNRIGAVSNRLAHKLHLVATGTGFYVTSSGYMITNAHVVNGCAEMRFSYEGGTQTPTIMATDKIDDLALLKASNPQEKYAIFRDGAGITAGDSITVLGYPLPGILSGELTVTNGLINALGGVEGRVTQFQFSAPIQPGNSGGPILDSHGHLVGITEAKLGDIWSAQATGNIPENVNFGINENTIRAFLDANSVTYQLSSTTSTVTAVEDVNQARQYTVLLQCWK